MKMNERDEKRILKAREILWQIMYDHGAHLKKVHELSTTDLAIFEAIEKLERITAPFDI